MKIYVKSFSELSNLEIFEIFRVRTQVFIVEQNCPYQDIDEIDKTCQHVFMKNQLGEVVAYSRVFNRLFDKKISQIGRVLTIVRGENLGYKIFDQAIKVAFDELDAEKIYIEAQVYAIDFYKKFGFEVVSEEFLEDDIPHVKMELTKVK